MKHCPTCRSNFDDDDLGYCTDDGTPLLTGANPFGSESQPTQVFPDPAATQVMEPPRPTDYGLGTPSSLPPTPQPYNWANESPPAWTPPPPPALYPVARQQQEQMTMAILSLVFGIAAITFGWICGGIILGILAVIFGVIAMVQNKKDPARYGGRPLAIGGLVTGGIVILIHLAIVAIWIVMLIIGAASK